MSQHSPAHFVAAAESYFAGQTEIQVRALSFSDLARIASGDAPLSFEAFRVNEDGEIVPVTVDVQRFRTGRALVNTTFAFDKSTGRLDRSRPLGVRMSAFITDADGHGDTRGYLFTTKDAERAAVFGNGKTAKETRKSLWLPVDSEVFNDDSTGKVTYKRLAKIHGTKVAAAFVVEGIAPSALEEKIRRFVAEEFGAAQGSVVSVETCPVLDKRVDVFHSITGEEIARGILADEIDLLPESETGYDISQAADSIDD